MEIQRHRFTSNHAAGKTPTDRAAIQRQIDPTDRQIDQLVYELCGRSDDEMCVVEEVTKR